MENRCISCKREIARGQQECHACGSSQSFIRYHLKSLLGFVALVLAFVWLSNWYIAESVKKAQLELVTTANIANQQSSETIQALELKLGQLNQQLEVANQQIQQTQANASQTSDTAMQAQLALEQAQSNASKAEARSNWLSRENNRHKAEIKQLTDQITNLQKTSQNSGGTLQQQLQDYQSQKQSLLDNISKKKAELEQSWQQNSDTGVLSTTPQLTAQRDQQVIDATADEQNQIKTLEVKIAAIKQKLLEDN